MHGTRLQVAEEVARHWEVKGERMEEREKGREKARLPLSQMHT